MHGVEVNTKWLSNAPTLAEKECFVLFDVCDSEARIPFDWQRGK